MEQRTEDGLSPYRVFSRVEWAERREDTPMTLTPEEVTRVRSLHDRLDIDEVEEIMGKDPWAHGITQNSPALDKFLSFSHSQGLLPKKPHLEELFIDLRQ